MVAWIYTLDPGMKSLDSVRDFGNSLDFIDKET